MQSFLSTPQLANSLNLPESLLTDVRSSAPDSKANLVNRIIVSNPNTAIVVSNDFPQGAELTSVKPVFNVANRLSTSAAPLLVAQIQAANHSGSPVNVLVQVQEKTLVDQRVLTGAVPNSRNMASGNQTVTNEVPLKSLTLLHSDSSGTRIPVKVIRSAPDQLVVSIDNPAQPQNQIKTLSDLPDKLFIPINNPPVRPSSGSQIWLGIDVKGHQLLLNWQNTQGSIAKSLGNIQQSVAKAIPLKQVLLASSAQTVELPRNLVKSDIGPIVLSGKTLQAHASIENRKLTVNANIPIAIARIKPAANSQSAPLKPDIIIAKSSLTAPATIARLPEVRINPINPQQDNQRLQSLLNTLSSEILTKANSKNAAEITMDGTTAEVKTALKQAVQILLRTALPKQNALPSIVQIKQDIEQSIVRGTGVSPDAKRGNSENLTQVLQSIESMLKPLVNTPSPLKSTQPGNETLQAPGSSIKKSDGQATVPMDKGKAEHQVAKVLQTNPSKILAESPTDLPKTGVKMPQIPDNYDQQQLAQTIKNTVTASLFPLVSQAIQQAQSLPTSHSLVSALIQIISLLSNKRTDGHQLKAALIPEPKAMKGRTNATGPQVNANQLDQPFLKQALDALSNHQINRLTSAENSLSGQDQLYYALPATDHLKHPTEFLVQPISQDNREKAKDAKPYKYKHWQLTMKLSVGDMGSVLAKAIMSDSELQLDLYTDDVSLLKKVKRILPIFEKRLNTLGLPPTQLSAQRGVLPDSLKPQSLNMLDTVI